MADILSYLKTGAIYSALRPVHERIWFGSFLSMFQWIGSRSNAIFRRCINPQERGTIMAEGLAGGHVSADATARKMGLAGLWCGGPRFIYISENFSGLVMLVRG